MSISNSNKKYFIHYLFWLQYSEFFNIFCAQKCWFIELNLTLGSDVVCIISVILEMEFSSKKLHFLFGNWRWLTTLTFWDLSNFKNMQCHVHTAQWTEPRLNTSEIRGLTMIEFSIWDVRGDVCYYLFCLHSHQSFEIVFTFYWCFMLEGHNSKKIKRH